MVYYFLAQDYHTIMNLASQGNEESLNIVRPGRKYFSVAFGRVGKDKLELKDCRKEDLALS